MRLRPFTACTVTPVRGYDVYGQVSLGTPFNAVCAVVKIQDRNVKTTVRSDSSGSRGHAEENTIDARLLFSPSVAIARGDKIEVNGVSVRVKEVLPRLNLYGVLDHNQVDGIAWQ